jgi:colanic acid/amylovoran biosynthesis glycosyltransferase
MKPKIAYIMSRFPHLPETFILREMIELEAQGWQVQLYPLIFQRQPVVHTEAQPWIQRAHRLPYLSLPVLVANLRQLVLHPGRYLSTWTQALWENRAHLSVFFRTVALFPKVVYAAEQMQKEGIAHIHAHYATYPAFAAWLIHRLTGIHYTVTVHAHDIFMCTAMLGLKLREADAIIAISEYNRQFLDRLLGDWVIAKTHVIHCGIYPDVYRLHQFSPEDKACFDLINIGSLQTYKGHRILIEACALLRDRDIPFRCRIVGGGKLYPLLQRLIEKHRLETMVELLGAKTQTEVADILPLADCYVQPSIVALDGQMEGIPVALMEAMASMVPVVATSISGIPELVRDGATGFMVAPENIQALADVLTTVYYTDTQKVNQIAQAGRAYVLQEFDLSVNVRKLSVLFEGLIEANRENHSTDIILNGHRNL